MRHMRGRTAEKVYPSVYSHPLAHCLRLLHHLQRLVQNCLARESRVDDFHYSFGGR